MARRAGGAISALEFAKRDREESKESHMRVFSIAVLAVVILAGSGAYVLKSVQETSAQADTTGSARLDHGESVNFHAR
jgi:hypothetical protein